MTAPVLTVAESLAAQMRRLPMTVTPGLRGARIAHVGGGTFDPVRCPVTGAPLEFAGPNGTYGFDAAYAAVKSAERLWAEWEVTIGRENA